MATPLKIGPKKMYWVQRLTVDAAGFQAAWSVMSPSGHAYDVSLSAEGFWDCTCPAQVFQSGKRGPCLHVKALMERFAANPAA